MPPQPRAAQVSPPKPWDQQQQPPGGALGSPSSAARPTTLASGAGGGGQYARPLSSVSGQPQQLGQQRGGLPVRTTGSAPAVAAGSGVAAGGIRRLSSVGGRPAITGGNAATVASRGAPGGEGSAAVVSTAQHDVGAATATAAGATAANGGLANGTSTAPVVGQQQQQQAGYGTYGGIQSGYGSTAGSYGPANRYGTTGAYGGAGGYGSSYGSSYGAGGYGGYGGYGGGYGGGMSSMYGGGYGSYGGGMYGASRHGMGGMGMGMGMGGMDQQYSWLHSIQHFTSSLGYLTEMLGMNTQAIGFVFANLMGFLEHIGNSLTSIQPWREFPPGHPRHGEPPPTPEEERRRLSRLRVLRFALTLVVAYAGFRVSRALHRLISGRHRP
ncbi:unnamed protein product, partial [Ectocarpus sp. 12 AP-2014]